MDFKSNTVLYYKSVDKSKCLCHKDVLLNWYIDQLKKYGVSKGGSAYVISWNYVTYH